MGPWCSPGHLKVNIEHMWWENSLTGTVCTGVVKCLFKHRDQACVQSHMKVDDDCGKLNNEPLDLNERKRNQKFDLS
jgi:hypothetical protein